jgi:hypothetical protein
MTEGKSRNMQRRYQQLIKTNVGTVVSILSFSESLFCRLSYFISFFYSGSSSPEIPWGFLLLGWCRYSLGPLTVHRSFQPPAEVFLVGISLKGSPSYLLGSEDLFFFHFVIHSGPTSNGDLRGRHLQCPIWVEGMDTTGCCLVPQGDYSWHWLITTPVPHSPRHDASHLVLGGLVLLRIKLSWASRT